MIWKKWLTNVWLKYGARVILECQWSKALKQIKIRKKSWKLNRPFARKTKEKGVFRIGKKHHELISRMFSMLTTAQMDRNNSRDWNG